MGEPYFDAFVAVTEVGYGSVGDGVALVDDSPGLGDGSVVSGSEGRVADTGFAEGDDFGGGEEGGGGGGGGEGEGGEGGEGTSERVPGDPESPGGGGRSEGGGDGEGGFHGGEDRGEAFVEPGVD